jgi:hypothetical protein|tara:strand:- start:411 stop:608 length:198 start_codon:yes stop_codon:yes gene_type:complete
VGINSLATFLQSKKEEIENAHKRRYLHSCVPLFCPSNGWNNWLRDVALEEEHPTLEGTPVGQALA